MLFGLLSDELVKRAATTGLRLPLFPSSHGECEQARDKWLATLLVSLLLLWRQTVWKNIPNMKIARRVAFIVHAENSDNEQKTREIRTTYVKSVYFTTRTHSKAKQSMALQATRSIMFGWNGIHRWIAVRFFLFCFQNSSLMTKKASNHLLLVPHWDCRCRWCCCGCYCVSIPHWSVSWFRNENRDTKKSSIIMSEVRSPKI